MSSYGRLSDGIFELLYGYQSDMMGTMVEGPLHHLHPSSVGEIVDGIMDLVMAYCNQQDAHRYMS